MKPRVKIQMDVDNGVRLHGKVLDHPRFEEGHSVWTSPIIARHVDGTVETLNTIYELV